VQWRDLGQWHREQLWIEQCQLISVTLDGCRRQFLLGMLAQEFLQIRTL
jgi:hypothetical protein